MRPGTDGRQNLSSLFQPSISYNVSLSFSDLIRQIRNAFQTAIALSEHQSMVKAPEDPVPTLGREQFETVARGFTQFDEYLKKTLGGTEADVARRESYRNDNFMNPGNPPAPMVPPQSSYKRQTPDKNVMDLDSDDESDSDTESDKDTDDELEQTKKGKSGAAGQEMAATSGQIADDMDEFREYMLWKQRKYCETNRVFKQHAVRR